MKSFTILSSLALAFVPFVAAHGIVTELTVDGKKYQGPEPGRGSKNSVIRQVSTINPTKGATNPAVNCGPGAQPAALSAPAKPGSSLLFLWKASRSQKWPHNLGSEFTYMAKCDGDCSKFDHRNAKWFKIGQDGLQNGQWAQTRDAFAGKPSPARVPDNLAPGNYLVMHQLISLHLADNFRGAEFYSSCAQLQVTGSGTGVPSKNELVSFPGAYNDNDKGIFINVFDPVRNYPFPGPPIAQLGGRSPAGPVNNNNGEEPSPEQPTPENNSGEAPSPEQPTPENNNNGDKPPTEQPSQPSVPENEGPYPENNKPAPENNKPTRENKEDGSCKKTKRSHKAKRSSGYKPRHLSRIMRDITDDLSS